MENKTCLKPPTRTYNILSLQKINVESTKIYKVVKLEKNKPSPRALLSLKRSHCGETLSPVMIFPHMFTPTLGVAVQIDQTIQRTNDGNPDSTGRTLHRACRRMICVKSKCRFCILCSKPAQKTFQIKTCWGWFTRML